MPDSSANVLIVGGGPIGLLTALLLAKRGFSPTIVERYPSPLPVPKAHVINPRSLEIFRSTGIDVDAIRAMGTQSNDMRVVRFHTTLAGRDFGAVPYERQDETVLDITPTPLLSIPQPLLEKQLSSLVAAEPRITMRRECIWQAVEQHGGRCLSTLLSNGEQSQFESQYVLACDGAGSSVREALKIPMTSFSGSQSCLNIHFHANLRHIVGERTAMIYWIINPEIAGALIAHNIDHEWVFLVFEGIGSRSSDDPDSIIRAVIGADAEFKVQRSVPWTMTTEVASRYREGNVFLVGDAAHRFPPAGGLGLNTGVQEAHNLAWKLAAVRDGWADASLLDSYESERQVIATANSKQSLSNIETGPRLAMAMMAAATHGDAELPPEITQELEAAKEANKVTFDCLGMHLGYSYNPSHPIAESPGVYVPRAASGDRLPHAWIDLQGRRLSVLDLLATDRFTLLTTATDPAFAQRAERALKAVPITVVPVTADGSFPDHWLKLTQLDRAGLLLVRPDGHILLHANGTDDVALAKLAAVAADLCGLAHI